MMRFEKVHTIRDIYDGPRTGTADFGGDPHYFSSVFDDRAGDYSSNFHLYPVSSHFMEAELRHWAIYRSWEAQFHRGHVSVETHPGHGALNAHYDDLSRWLDEQIGALDPVPFLVTATFRAFRTKRNCPAGVLRMLEVAWSPVETQRQNQMPL